MNDTVQGGAPADDGVTAGMLLRRAREAAGMHVATLAVSLKVPVRKLEALEEDRYDQLSDAVFVRALASSVCRTLKIDPQPVLDRLPQSGKPRLLQADEGINTPFRAPGDAPRANWLQLLTRPVSLIVLALLIGAGVILLPASRRDEAPQTATRTDLVMPPGTPAAVVTPPADSAPQPASAATSVTTIAPAALAPTAPVAAASAVRPAASQAAAAAPAASAASATVAASATDGIVVFRAKGPSWVQVVDAKGTMVFRKLLEPGETAGASGALPLAVTVGSVKETEVQVRGKPFDLASVSRDNVARFEVK
jgi:cytoskeleton protein RodZ